LACMVYIDLNPVRAGMVEQAADFKWSSHRHCIGQWSDKLVSPHALFWGLGNTPFAREAAYAGLVQTGLAQSQKEQLTQSALSGWALGSANFVGGLQQNTTRRLVPGKAGRPAKKPID
jgi:putative transposase